MPDGAIPPDQLNPMIADASAASGVPTNVLTPLVHVESRGVPTARNPVSGASGLMQVIPSTAADPGYGMEPYPANGDAQEQLRWGARYLAARARAAGINGPDDWKDPSKAAAALGAYHGARTDANGVNGAGYAGMILNGGTAPGGAQMAATTADQLGIIRQAYAEKAAAQAPIIAGIQERQAKDQARFDAIAKDYTPFNPTPPPQTPDNDPLKGFASAGAIFASLAAGFSHTPAIAAMNGMAGAINATKQNDWQQYEAQYQQWKDGTQNALERHRLLSDDMKAALDVMKDDLTTGSAMMKVAAANADDKIAMHLLELGQTDKMWELWNARDAAAQRMAENAMKLQQLNDEMLDRKARDAFAVKMAAAKTPEERDAVRQEVLDYEAAKTPGAAQTQRYQGNLTGKKFDDQLSQQAWNNWLTQYRQQNGRDPTDQEMITKRAEIESQFKNKFGQPVIAQVAKPDGSSEMVLAQQDQATGQWVTADEKRTPLDGTVQGVRKAGDTPPANDPTVAAVAKQIANYQMPPLSSFAERTPWGQAVMAEVTKANPDYQGNEYGTRGKAMRDFSTGKQGQQLTSFNTAVSHLDLLSQISGALASGNSQSVNALQNLVRREFGGTGITDFNAAKQIVGEEIIKAIVAGGGGVTERQEAGKAISASQTPQQLQEVIETYKRLMAGQVRSLKLQYEQTTGLKNFDDRLLPETRQELEREQVSSMSGKLPPVALTKLKEGVVTTFGNGQRWTLRGGQPVQVQQ